MRNAGGASEAAAGAENFVRREAELAASLAQMTSSRDELAQRLHESVTTLERALETRAAESTAALGQLKRREAELAEATAVRTALERRLTDADAAFRYAEDRAGAERVAAAKAADERYV